MRRLLPLALLLAAALAVGAALIGPVWVDPGALAPASRFTDGHLIGLGLWGQAIARGGLPELHTALVGWPSGADLRPLLWPSALLAAFVGPVWALAVTYALTPAFNAACGWVLGGSLGRGPEGRVLLGGLLAAHPWVVETLTNGQVEQALIGGAALQLAATIGAVRARSAAWLVLPALTTALVGWAAPHVALAGVLLAGSWGVIAVARGPSRGRWLLALAAVGLGALAVQAYHGPSFGPGVHVFAPKGSAGRPAALQGVPEFATLRGLLLPPARAPGVEVVHPAWLGACLVGAAAWAVVARWGGAGGGGASGERGASGGTGSGGATVAADRVGERDGSGVGVGAAIGIAGVFAVLALGPSVAVGGAALPLPWSALAAAAPTVAQSMSAYRMVIGAVVALAIAASAAPRGGRSRWVVAGLVLAALAEGPLAATRGAPIAAQVERPDAAGPALAAGPGPVLDLPLAGPECPRGAGHYLLEATYTARPVPVLLTNPRDGYAAFPTLVDDLARAWRRRDCPEELREVLDAHPFTAVVLHAHDPDCPVQRHVATCLHAALGAGHTTEDGTWWAVK